MATFSLSAIKGKIHNPIMDRMLSVLTDVVLYFTFVMIALKSFVLVGFVISENHSFLNLLTSYQRVSSPAFYLSFVIMLLSFSYLFKGRGHLWFLVILNLIMSLLFLIDLWYYRAYGNFLTVHLLIHTFGWKDLSQKVFPMINIKDITFIIDVLLLAVVCLIYKTPYKKMFRSIILFVIMFGISTGYIYYMHYKVDVTKKVNSYYLFYMVWTANETITDLSPIGYHVFDAYFYWDECRHISLSAQNKDEIKQWFENKKEALSDNRYKGIFKGKNLIFIQVESLENFVINQKMNGIEITPTLNSLLKNSLYFSNYEEEINNGNSSDGDLLVNTSVYPVRRDYTFWRFPYNTYNSLPKLLQKQGYSTLAVKSDRPAGWNWVQALYGIGFQKCYDMSSFNIDERIGLGLSDASFLRQAEPILTKQKQPFYSFVVTLTSHGPFDLPAKYRELGLSESLGKTTMGGYMESVHYTDKQLGLFLDNLKKDGMLDNTVIAVSGDHCGIHRYYNSQIYNIHPSESWWFGNGKRLPLIIYQNRLQGEELKINGGQVDVLPTLAYLMGIDDKEIENTAMGRNLLKTKKDYAVFSDGTFYGNDTDKKEDAVKGLDIADMIIRGDYFKSLGY